VNETQEARPTITARGRRRATVVTALLAACFALAGCEAPPPSVTWFGNGTSVDVGPALYCTLTNQPAPNCTETDGPVARLTLRPGDTVQVNIPAEVAEQPWVLVFSYVNDSASYRTPVNTDGRTLSYLIKPIAGEQLKQVDLQVPILTASPDGAPQFTPYRDWILMVDPQS
jgi:hypothetical protein